MKKPKFYGQTFLTKRRKFTEDELKAVTSIFMYGYDEKIKKYYTSYLGMINGFLEKVGLALAVELKKTSDEVVGLSIHRLKNKAEEGK